VYNYACTDGAPSYITIGDGGNAEGLASGWVTPQPEWSVFRQASYGFGELTAINSTHAYWAWHQNPDLVPAIADEYYFIKGKGAGALKGQKQGQSQGHVAGSGTTGTPVFAKNALGDRARVFNKAALLEVESHKDTSIIGG
jgi:hypothetical protein